MGARLTDHQMYAHLWGSAEVRELFDEPARVQAWLDILAALARAQGEIGIIPAEAATAITEQARVDRLDLTAVGAATRETGHSTLGLIREMRAQMPPIAAEHFYVGATVQDITDTWMVLTMKRVAAIIWRDLRRLEAGLLRLAETHRDDLMCGRTHAQPGTPITFGWKAASWADEMRRHLQRLQQAGDRLFVGQLGSGVGNLVLYSPDGIALRERFCAEVGLAAPATSWLTARDRVAEFGALLAMITASIARIGNEVFDLQRPEIGELAEGRPDTVVGSITMHHKRNPEGSEHLDTLARLVRSQAELLIAGMSGVGERDGRSWKTEWFAWPEICLLGCQSLQLAVGLVEGLEVNTDRMAANVERLLADTQFPDNPGEVGAMVDAVLAEAAAQRAAEPEVWP